MFFIPFLVYALLAVYEFVPLYKEKLWSDLILNAVLWVLSFTIAILLSFNVRLTGPQDFIKEIISFILKVGNT